MKRKFSIMAFVAAALLAGVGAAFAGVDVSTAAAVALAPLFVGEVDVQKLIEGIGQGFEEYKKTNDARIEAMKKGLPTGDLEAKLAKIDKDLNDLSEAKSAIEEIQKKLNRPDLADGKSVADAQLELKQFNASRKASAPSRHTGDVDLEVYGAYKKAMDKCLRQGLDALDGDERKALSTGVDPDGGWLLPANTVGRTVSKIYETSVLRQYATVQVIGTQSLEGLIDNDEADAGFVGETQARTGNDGTPQVGKWKIETHEMYSQPSATQTMLDDSAVDVEAWLAGKVSKKMGRVENTKFCVGLGVTAPRGFCAYDTAATDDDSRAWGTFEHIVTGTNGAFGGTPATAQDKLLDVIGAMRPEYLSNSRWFTRREVITLIRKMKDGNNLYLWQPSLQAGKPDQLLGYETVILPDMPALSTNGLSLAFGDMAETYTIVDRIGIRVIRDNLTNKPFIKFYTTKRVGGGALNFESLKFLKFST